MTVYDLQVPWTDEQWARVNQVIQEEARRARVAATFLPLFGPLPADTDFIRRGDINYQPHTPPPPAQHIVIDDETTMRLATVQVKVDVRAAQMADSDLTSVLAYFRRAANVLARLEDAIVFRGLIVNPLYRRPPGGALIGMPPIWEIAGGQTSRGLLGPPGSHTIQVLPTPGLTLGARLVQATSNAIGQLERRGHFGPFAAVLDQEFFLAVQTPDVGSLVLPQDRILPFLGGGPLLRSSTLPRYRGIVVALGAAPVELVVASDVSVQFLQVTNEPRYLFRVREKMALRIKEVDAIAMLLP
jgi:uncharacterized linocin/CFP29 family protein